MVFVKVRETYDLHTITDKMTVISIHTPRSEILKLNFPGLFLQCKAYRPYSCDVRLACASVLPVDPLGVGTSAGDVAPEDLFNPILYKAISNMGMSQLESRIAALSMESSGGSSDVIGHSVNVDVDSTTNRADEFTVYYGLLSNAHNWKHANPQQGLEMNGLRPLVYEMLYNIGENDLSLDSNFSLPKDDGTRITNTAVSFRGNPKPMPMINCTSFSTGTAGTGFVLADNAVIENHEVDIPAPTVCVGAIIIPPSRLHSLYYRMVVEWTLEFSSIRPVSEIVGWSDLAAIGGRTHFQNYSYETTKELLTGTDESILDSDVSLASANVDIKKVM